MKLGVMQGRLSIPVDGHIQEFPRIFWMSEFLKLPHLKLNHIEWLITKNFNKNPILSTKYQLHSLPINSVCADNLVDKDIADIDFLEKELAPLCKGAINNGVSSITIPLLEDSSLIDKSKREKFCKNIKKITDDFPKKLSYTFEAELGIDELLEIVTLDENYFVTYDTGNITSFGIDHEEYISKLSTKINNVHLKDRTFDAKTVPPGTGDTDFKTIFAALKKIGYNSTYTLQTAREETGSETETIMKHKKYFKETYNE